MMLCDLGDGISLLFHIHPNQYNVSCDEIQVSKLKIGYFYLLLMAFKDLQRNKAFESLSAVSQAHLGAYETGGRSPSLICKNDIGGIKDR